MTDKTAKSPDFTRPDRRAKCLHGIALSEHCQECAKGRLTTRPRSIIQEQYEVAWRLKESLR